MFQNVCLSHRVRRRSVFAMVGLALLAAVSVGRAVPAGIRGFPVPPNADVALTDFPFMTQDQFGGSWSIQPDGTVSDGDLFESGASLSVGDRPFAPGQINATLDGTHHEVVFAAEKMNGLLVSRRVRIEPKAGWCRWVEILENTGVAPVKTQVRLTFQLGDQIQQSHDIVDAKHGRKPVGFATFDGSHGMVMIGAGHSGGVSPRFSSQPNANRYDVFYDLQIPAHKKVALAHLQIHRATLNDVVAYAETDRDKEYLADLPADLVKSIANFVRGGQLVGDIEVLRGGLLDVVELRGGDQYRGTLKDPTYKLQTLFGPLELPADQVVGMMTVGSFRPSQLFITADGEVIGGALQAESIHLQLSSGQPIAVPTANITRLGYRNRPGESQDWKLDKPMAFLRDGQRVAITLPDESIPLATVFGQLMLKPSLIASLTFQADDAPVHQVRLTDGSQFSSLVAVDSFTLALARAGAGKSVKLPAGSLARLQFSSIPDESDDEAPRLSLTNGDALVAVLGGEIAIQTGFDVIRINAAEIRGIRHAEPSTSGVPAAPSEVQVTLWDGATVSGRLDTDTLNCTLRCGTAVAVPIGYVNTYSQPNPQPSAELLSRIKSTVTELDDKDWKRRDRAVERLRQLGPSVGPVLKSLRDGQPPEAQKAIDGLLKSIDAAKKSAAAPPTPANDGAGEHIPVQLGPGVLNRQE